MCRFDDDALLYLSRAHWAFLAFVFWTTLLERDDLEYAYGLYLQSCFGDYSNYAKYETDLVCVRTKCCLLKLADPEPHYKSWSYFEGLDSEVAGELFNEFMGLVDVNYSKRYRLNAIIQGPL
uniref:ARAD1C27192p n=1 Tax=Blastobotrys adeninivorans TaxID=409370 RepID=A0A060T870_BLAAD